jgi:hypothetical protein
MIDAIAANEKQTRYLVRIKSNADRLAPHHGFIDLKIEAGKIDLSWDMALNLLAKEAVKPS